MSFTEGPIGTSGYSALRLADEPIEFVHSQLTKLGLKLANMIVDRFPELAGDYYAVVPSGTTRARAILFNAGWPGPLSADSRLAAAIVIVDLIESAGRGFAIGGSARDY